MAVDDDATAADTALEPADTAHSTGSTSRRSGGTVGSKTSRWEDDSDDDEGLPGGDDGSDGSWGQGQGAGRLGGNSRGTSGAAGGDANGGPGVSPRPKKKVKLADGVALDAFDAESLLAGVNQELELLDAAEGAAGRVGSGGLGSSRTSGAANSSGSSGGRPSGILKKGGTPNSRCKKVRVRWPDLGDPQEQQQMGFRIAPPVKPVSGWCKAAGGRRRGRRGNSGGATNRSRNSNRCRGGRLAQRTALC